MSAPDITRIIQHNLQSVHAEIRQACRNVGRDPAGVQLVAVTKYADWEWVTALSRLHTVFGENRPQQLAERQLLLPQVQWHLIGQLQRNKVRLALEHAAVIHSVDSLRLLERLAAVAAELRLQPTPTILLQVNTTGEASKSGFTADELRHSWPEILAHSATVQITGLMTMAAATDHPEEARPAFRALRELRDELAAAAAAASVPLTLPELSMGMSGDFVPAVEEGATLVRIGSRLFAGLG